MSNSNISINTRLEHLESLLEEVCSGYKATINEMLREMKEIGPKSENIDFFLDGRGEANAGRNDIDGLVSVEVAGNLTAREKLLQAIVTIVLELQRLDLKLSTEYALLISTNH